MIKVTPTVGYVEILTFRLVFRLPRIRPFCHCKMSDLRSREEQYACNDAIDDEDDLKPV